MKFSVARFICMIIMIVMVIMIVVVVIMIVVIIMVVMIVVVVVVVSTFKFCTRLNNRTGGSIRQDKQIKGRNELLKRRINCRKINIALRFVFKSNDVCTRRLEFHRDRISINRDIQCANTVLMGTQLTRILSKRRNRGEKCNNRKCLFHGFSI